MKNLLLLVVLITTTFTVSAQSSFRKKYVVADSIVFYSKIKPCKKKCKSDKTKSRAKKKECKTNCKREPVDTAYVLKKKKKTVIVSDTIIRETTINDTLTTEIIVTKKQVKKDTFERVFLTTELSQKKVSKANVAFKKDKIWINPWLANMNEIRENEYCYKLKNRQMIQLNYRQWTIAPITIPLKIQFGKENLTQFSTSVSLGGLIGHSWGKTNFTYRKNLENFERNHELTLGAVFSFSPVDLEHTDEDTELVFERSTAATSLGLALTYSYEKINMGVAGGVEFAHGYGAKYWDFQNRPWLGIIFGYSLFD